MNSTNHPYHIIPLSPWPILTSFSLLLITGGMVMYMHSFSLGIYILISGLIALIFCVALGTGKVLEEFESLKHVLFKQD